jgi:hypothetical protein
MIKEKLLEFAAKYYDDLTHPLAVASQFEDLSDEWVVGLFHDILEDNLDLPKQERSILTHKVIEILDHNWDVFRAIQHLTRVKDVETYYEYIEFIKYMKDNNKQGGELAWKVKLADLKHNLSRTETLKPSLKKRYEEALKILMK